MNGLQSETFSEERYKKKSSPSFLTFSLVNSLSSPAEFAIRVLAFKYIDSGMSRPSRVYSAVDGNSLPLFTAGIKVVTVIIGCVFVSIYGKGFGSILLLLELSLHSLTENI